MQSNHAAAVCRHRVSAVGLEVDQEALGRECIATSELHQRLIRECHESFRSGCRGVAPSQQCLVGVPLLAIENLRGSEIRIKHCKCPLMPKLLSYCQFGVRAVFTLEQINVRNSDGHRVLWRHLQQPLTILIHVVITRVIRRTYRSLVGQ